MADDASLRIADLAADEVIRLWPGAPPVEGASAGPEQAYVGMVGRTATTMYRNVSDPSLHVFRPDPAKANGVGVIIAPGGGWQILAWEHEGVVLARWLAARGYAAFVLRYRVLQTPADPKAYAEASATQSKAMADRLAERGALSPSSVLRGERVEKGRALALADGRRAMELVRERAKAFGVDPQKVGMIGFSAGAFLVADVALHPGGAAQMAFCAPIYGGAIGEDAVPADAPPYFSAVAQDDLLLIRAVEGLYRAWSEAGRKAELHVFARGGHGFGMVPLNAPVDRWVDLFVDWLADLDLA